MRVPGKRGVEGRRRGGWWGRLARRAVGVGALVPVVALGADKKPWLQLPLQTLGFPGVSSTFLGAGSSVLTVHFIDGSHLLVTYALRKLVPRLEQDPGDHEDRLVAAEVVNLPDGKVEAKTEWHMHDHGRYLWALGGGRFLVRIGEQMYTMDTLANLGAKDPFTRTLFPSRGVKPSLVVVSPDGGVVTLETVAPQVEQNGKIRVVLGDDDTAAALRSTTAIEFFRLRQDDATGGFEAVRAGGVQSPGPVFLPIDADGYLWAEDSGNGLWSVTFDGFGGKTIDLGKMKSSCQPRLQMLSRSEFLAMTCQGSDDRIKMASYGLDGAETWEELVGDFGRPSFAFAAAAGRFAISGTGSAEITGSVLPGTPPTGPRQEVRVYQNVSGDLLLRVDCSPAFKTAENFDLSADGTMAAVVRNGAIAVYKLPPLSKRDAQDMAEIAAFAPPVSMADVSLKRLTVRPRVERVSTEGVESRLAPAPVTPVMGTSFAASPRKAPTLLKPGEKPEFGSANAAPK